ncbi:MAG: hypothetical protein EHM85_20240 [Desulfobacteraceae bacterium]|nr:MAG: hypothetical protein EHM85_20240 [Desulfobacteraceae bacterium]
MANGNGNRIRVGLNEAGEIVLYGSELGTVLTDSGAENLISMITTAKQDSKEIKTALKKIISIKKQYNSVGKPLEHANVKPVEGGALPEGVINDEAA